MSDILEQVVPETEQPVTPPPRPEKRKIPLTARVWAKTIAFILTVAMTCLCGLSVLGAAVMVNEEVYTTPHPEYLERTIERMALRDAYSVAIMALDEATQQANRYLQNRNIASAVLRVEGKDEPALAYHSARLGEQKRVYTVEVARWEHEGRQNLTYAESMPPDAVCLERGTMELRLSDGFILQDEYRLAGQIISAMYYFRYSVYLIMAVSALLAVVGFVFLMCAAGRHPEYEGIRPGWGTKIPVDVLTAAVGMAGLCIGALMAEASMRDTVTMVVVWAVGTVVLLAMLLGWCMSMALRLKLGGWWKNSVCWWCVKLCWGICLGCFRAVRWCWRGTAALLTGIPLVWKVLVLFCVVGFAESLVWALYHRDPDVVIFWWFAEKCILFPIVIAVALMLRRLERGGQAIAEGNLNYQIDTKRMLPAFKRHGEHLNRIGEGLNRAVEERTRSERMKTELITNVSHDIKTPLTSIINYADLIGREPCENETITEYAGVLHRQSERLKRLIDDLVEASKASTGNMEIKLAPCEVGVLLTQTVGEYEYRLQEQGLELVTRCPDRPLTIMADGRRLWRVLDNLMSNVCKYAQSGTRVYLTLEKVNAQAVITLKNISREPLDLSPEELTERFVRGDAARRSEGSGLGLSIARSLTELQRGKLELSVDGDLFKAVLRFPVLP